MTVRLLTSEEIQTEYPGLFTKVFGKPPTLPLPPIVAITKGKEGFLSGYWHGSQTFYIQYCGVMPEYQGKDFGTGYLKEGLGYIVENLNAKFFVTYTPNWNTPAMKVLINCGFYVFGIRQTTAGELLVEWLKIAGDKDGTT